MRQRGGRDPLMDQDDETRKRDRLTAVFLLGIVLFNPVIIRVFDVGATATVFGVPVLYAYFFGAWAAIILLKIAVTERAAADDDDAGDVADDANVDRRQGRRAG
jgi:hypothetical protein